MKVEIKRPYQHFKGNLYYVHDLITHTENEEVLVSYQALYPPYEMFARPLEMFLEKIDCNHPENTTGQSTRFALCDSSKVERD